MKRAYAIVLVAAALLIAGALVLQGDGADAITAWLRRLHGQ
jgi:hypothetical protein